MKVRPILSLILAAFCLTGCSALDRLVLRPQLVTNSIPAQVITLYVTNTVPQVVTNTVMTVDRQIVTNTVTLTNTVIQPLLITNPPMTVVITNGFSVAPSMQATANTVGAVSSFAVPGFGGLISNVLLGAAGLYAAARGARYKNASEIATDSSVALVKAIEATRIGLHSLPPDKAIMGAKIDDHLLEQIQTAVGKTGDVAAFVVQLVADHTGNTTSQTLGKKLS